jgi:hypothetical protein
LLAIRQSRHEGNGGMPAPGAPLWATGSWKSFATPERRILLLSIVLQLALATLFGHSYDTRVFMGTGYLVGNGHNPYVPQDLSAVFHHVLFNARGTVGYPPPWPLILGLLYHGSYALFPNLFIYNLVLKLPVVLANIGLAYLVAAVLKNLGAEPQVARKAWVFILLNPLLLYFGAAWGQIDSIVALLALAALVLLYARRSVSSAALLALAVCFKPIAAPILLVVLVYLLGQSWRQALRYAAVFVAGVFVFYLLPFLLLSWSLPPARLVNAHFTMSGGMSFMAVVRLLRGTVLLHGHWWLLGLAWIPALAMAAYGLRRGVGDFSDLVRKSAALVLVFFLTRTWLAEPDVVLVFALVALATSLGALDRRALTAIWVIPLMFTAFNVSPLRLLWVAFPGPMERWLAFVGQHGHAMVIGRAVLAIFWQIAGWWIVITCFRRRPAAATGTEHRPGAPARDPARAETADSGAAVRANRSNGVAANGGVARGLVPWS